MVSYPQYPPQEPSQGGGMPPMQQPMPQPMPQYYPKPRTELSQLFSSSLIIIFILVGLILMWVGTVIFAANIPSPSSTLVEVAVMIYALGATLLSFILLIIPLVKKEMAMGVKIAFILAAVVIILFAYIRFVHL